MTTSAQVANQPKPSAKVSLAIRLALLLLAAVMVRPALAGVHPVPLEKNVDAAKCLECHEDKTKGKAVHSAIAMGCLSCHEIRVNKDITRTKLIKTTSASLCISCHADKDAARHQGHRPQPRRPRLCEVP